MGVNINFVGKTQCEGSYVDLDVQLAPKQATDAPDTRKADIKMKFWKDLATRNLAGSIPFNDQINGAGDSRIIGFKCIYNFILDLTSPLNPYQQAYAYLKTLPEFASATDDLTDNQATQLDVIQTAAVSVKTQISDAMSVKTQSNNTINKVGL